MIATADDSSSAHMSGLATWRSSSTSADGPDASGRRLGPDRSSRRWASSDVSPSPSVPSRSSTACSGSACHAAAFA